MAIFAENEAQYFCDRFDSSIGLLNESINNYCRRVTGTSTRMTEGTSKYNELRSNLLRNSERDLILAASNYYSTHRLMVAGFASWAQVTSYYCAFYSARALLCMFGIYISAPIIYVDVLNGTIGAQELQIRTNQAAKRNYGAIAPGIYGSHQIFWDVYYESVRALHPYVIEADLRLAIIPNNNNKTWLIESRNEVNYDALKAVDLIRNFDNQFRANSFPASLPGSLSTQFNLSQAFISLAYKYAKQFRLNTDALNCLPGRRNLSNKLRRFIFKAKKGIPVANSMRQSME